MKAKQAGILSALSCIDLLRWTVLLVAVGLGSGAGFVGRYHWLFLIGGIAVLTWAWAKYLREKTVCDCEHKTMRERRSGMFTLLIATVIVLRFWQLKYESLHVRKRPTFREAKAQAQTA